MSGFLNTKLYSPTLPILLRIPESRDASAFSAILSNPANIKFDPIIPLEGIPPTKAAASIAAMRGSASEPVPTRVNFMVVRVSSPGSQDEIEIIGLSGFGGIDEINGKRWADVGVMLNPSQRGKGYAIESIRMSIDFAFENLRIAGVSCHMLKENTPMVNLLERKFGWAGRKGGSSHAKVQGREEVSYEVTREDWMRTKEKQGWE